MPKLIGGLAGLVALAAGIFGNVEPFLCCQRAVVALISGMCLGALWQAFTSVPVQLRVIPTTAASKKPEAEEGDQAKAA